MSEPGKAVFLSYASQDAEAAKRIAYALRGAGVEVWFDAEGGLEHGDEWDAKIRRQIKECVLFIAVISANTQAREEGYFRIEWELAAQRALGIAGGVAFILPVVIDGTREPEALVPDRFRSVQWTRLPGGEVPPDVLQRFLKLWSHRTGALKQASVEAGRPHFVGDERRTGDTSPAGKSRTGWRVPVGVLALIATAGGLWFGLRPVSSAASASLATPVSQPAPVATLSEARQLVAKALGLVRALDATREDFALAEEYCQRALKLDPDDGAVWAAASQMHGAYIYRGWDTTPARKEQNRATAERAMRLAPTSAAARLAQAGAWSTFNINRDEREKLLRAILRDEPDNQETLRFLAVTVLAKPDGLEECLALNEQSAALPGGDPLALFNNARYLWTRGRAVEGYASLQRALAQRTFTSALVLKMAMEITWRGDFAAAADTFGGLPPAALQEDRANYIAGLLRYYQGNAAAALEIWQAFPRDYYVDFVYEGPKGLLVGLADELDHRDAAAKVEWRAALQVAEKKIAAAPNKATAYYSQAYLLACLGEKAAAAEALRTYEQLADIKYSAEQPMTIPLAKVYARLGRLDDVFAFPPTGGVAILRFSPDLAALRADPRFHQLIERLEGTPSPTIGAVTIPNAPSAKASAVTEVAAKDDKSVAVLAFANLSDDKANEYFSDGISEELLNVLAKVPGLKVTARTSSFHFKGTNTAIPEIARQLGVAYVVEGSVRKSGDKVRITAQLVKAVDGFHVWSDTFTRDVKDVFAVQDEIAGLVAKNLAAKLGAATRTGTMVDGRAFELYMQGRAAWNRRNAEGFDRAESLFRQALEIAPEFARAHAALGDVWMIRAIADDKLGLYAQRASPVIPPIEAEVQRALELDPESAEAYTTLGFLRQLQHRPEEALRLLRRAVELNPNYATGHHWLAGALAYECRFEESIAEYQRAVAIDPLSPRILDNYGWGLVALGRLSEGLALFERSLALHPGEPQALAHQVMTLAKLGRREEARALTGGTAPALRAAILCATADRTELEAALATGSRADRFALLCALGRPDEALNNFHADDVVLEDAQDWFFFPELVPFHQDPRFRRVVAELGLEENLARALAWQAAHPPAKRVGQP
jgi:TolB-like protein/Flp pilus assembly protein TadD